MIHVRHQVLFEAEGDTALIRLCGEIDHHSAISVRVEIDEYLRAERPKLVYMDLSRIDFMDSSGLGLIMGRLATVNRYGGNFILLNPSSAAKRMIQLASLDRVIQIQFSNSERSFQK